jgi:hypothetical protein
MAKDDKNRHELSIEQLNAIYLLITGKTDQEVAEQAGCSRQTICEWRNNHSAFIAELNSRRQGLWGAQTERLRGLVGKAIEVLGADLECKGDPRRRQAAAVCGQPETSCIFLRAGFIRDLGR